MIFIIDTSETRTKKQKRRPFRAPHYIYYIKSESAMSMDFEALRVDSPFCIKRLYVNLYKKDIEMWKILCYIIDTERER